MFVKKAKKSEETTVAEFIPNGQRFADGSVRYKIFCDGGVNPSGVFWTKTVPGGSPIEDFQAAEAERDAKIKELAGL